MEKPTTTVVSDHCNLTGSYINRSFSLSDLSRKVISGHYKNCYFLATSLKQCKIKNAYFFKCHFSGADFEEAELRNCQFYECNFSGSSLGKAKKVSICRFYDTCTGLEQLKEGAGIDVKKSGIKGIYTVKLKAKDKSDRPVCPTEANPSDTYDNEYEEMCAAWCGFHGYSNINDYSGPKEKKAVLDCPNIEEFKGHRSVFKR